MDPITEKALSETLLPSVLEDIAESLQTGKLPRYDYHGAKVITGNFWQDFTPPELNPQQRMALPLLGPSMDPEGLPLLRHDIAMRQLLEARKELLWLNRVVPYLKEWEKAAPFSYISSRLEADKYLKSYCKQVQEPKHRELIHTSRMAAHMLLFAHLTGQVVTAPEGHIKLRSAGLQSLILNSEPSKAGVLNSLSYFPEGRPVHLDFLTRDTKRIGLAPLDLFDEVIQETDSQSGIYKQGHPQIRWTTNHVVQQIAASVIPLLSQAPIRLKQKGCEPDLYFAQFALIDRLGDSLKADHKPLPHAGFAPKSLSLVSITNPAIEEWKELFEAQPGGKDFMQGSQDDLLQTRADYACEGLGLEQKLFERSLILGFRSADNRLYEDLAVSSYKSLNPTRFKDLSVKVLPSIKTRLSAAEVDEAREKMVSQVMREVEKDPGLTPKVMAALQKSQTISVYTPAAPAEIKGNFPPQKHPMMPAPDLPSADSISFIKTAIPLSEAAQFQGPFLSAAHYADLSINGKGVLPDHIIAMQGISTTFSEERVAEAYSHFLPDLTDRSMRFAEKICRVQSSTGTLLIPYLHRSGDALSGRENSEVSVDKEEEQKGLPLVRIRTNTHDTKALAKYYSPGLKAFKDLAPERPVREIPMYLYAPMVSDRALETVRDILIEKAAAELGKDPHKIHDLSCEILNKSGFNRLQNALDDPSIPVFAIEGEKKALAANAMQEQLFLRSLKDALQQPDPASFMERIQTVPVMAPIGMIGVWWTHSPKGTSQHEIRPEIKETVALKGRQFIIAHDNDGADKIEVAAAAATCAAALHRDHDSKPMYWRTPKGPDKGLDDYIAGLAKKSTEPWPVAVGNAYITAARAFKRTLSPIRTDLSYASLEQAKKGGLKDFQEFLVSSPPIAEPALIDR